jgi:hypothetical protein
MKDFTWKITEAKRARGMAQVVEYLPGKFETLNLNLNITTKKGESFELTFNRL